MGHAAYRSENLITNRPPLFLLVASLASFLLPSEALAISCWNCQNQLDTCRYYRQGELDWCLDGCSRNPYQGCSSDCYNSYYSGLAACQSDYDYCANGCEIEVEKPKQNCPIVLDLGQRGWKFTSAPEGVLFDIDGDGRRDPIAWTDPAAEIAFLVWDRNLNGVIDSGRELFGDSTTQPPSAQPNGFLALALLDQADSGGNGDGVISTQDDMWGALQVWVDRNHNGLSETNELSSLASHKIVAIDLAYHESRRKDQHGNELRYRGRVLLEDRPFTDAVDVFFQKLP